MSLERPDLGDAQSIDPLSWKKQLHPCNRSGSQHWRGDRLIWQTHPMGESKRKQRVALSESAEGGDTPQVVDTLGGRMHVRWDRGAAATPHGQLVFFAEFLATTGVFERWVSECPLSYRSGNAPDKRDVLGTLMLGLLAGHRRYSHITALRGDTVAAQALGMNKVVSEDALRRALERIDESASAAWMRPALMHSVREALDRPWVLDIDASIKPLYGRQEGAELDYNPRRRAWRPSRAGLIRCSLGLGTIAASRCMNPSGDITRCVVPSRHGVLSLSTTCPAALVCTRSLARAGRVM